ncbi:RNA polymerase factor sigma-70 [Rhodococcus ruber Chol-4]|uniref:RNA polymerase sigma factor n=1 Tax=Rhodococcus ruber TaxID=1830 RepID=A0A098BSF3_9NOCA|nr:MULTISPECIES: sigma-70 family RNA polymerase sigma factor [Rhodococcus]MDO2380288.1 sigma-70 family RNA polymerase sigma factor [Rhodococcus ruber]RIK09200.1 MAG: RNA polymerase subunit sigma-70 [Acidobacteriota bacterium]ATQ29496.1 RNA polymerase subunit sigma-70 [Rhodococcus ruber]AUM18513.1 RNA polymerase subunit sigma-70 [Rhodococcus ruber]AWH00894.1 RNA polymerase subunit sigma-70 [Rhodococcus ruber]
MTEQVLDSQDDFLTLAGPYRRELLAHCYRMSGSIHDAEDLVQETYLRAWRGYANFGGRSSLRTWLHRIATNVCLTALEGRSRRPLPTGLGAPSSDPADDLVERGEVPWLEPIPGGSFGDDGRPDDPTDPAAIVTSRESIRLAFVAALQHLSARQRAVLLLRDVLQWRATEVAAALDTSTAAVNSLLQRARAQLEQAQVTKDDLVEPESPEAQALVRRWVEGFEKYDIDSIVEMLTQEAVWEMPPFEGWYRGAEAIGNLIRTHCPASGPGDQVLLPTVANGQPALGLYMRGEDGQHHPFQLQVLDVVGDRVVHVTVFFDTDLFALFGLPEHP